MLGDRIKELRKQEGLTQADLSKDLNVAQNTLSNWEAGNREPDIKTIEKTAKYFGVSVDFLIGKSNFKNGIENGSSFCIINDPCFEEAFDFGALIKSKREGTGITLNEMSSDLGLTASDLEDIEEGVLPINEEWANKLTEYLGTTISQILFDNGLYPGEVPEEYHDNVDEWESLAKANEQEIIKENSLRTDAPFAAFGKDDDDFSNDEIKQINNFIEFVKKQRGDN